MASGGCCRRLPPPPPPRRYHSRPPCGGGDGGLTADGRHRRRRRRLFSLEDEPHTVTHTHRSVSCALCHTFSCYNLLARSFVIYPLSDAARSLRPPYEKHWRTHARTTHKRAPARTCCSSYDDRFVYVRRPLLRPRSSADPRLRPHADDAISTRCIDATTAVAAAIWSSSAGQSPTPSVVYNIREQRIFAAEYYYFRRKIVLSSHRLRLLRHRNNNIIKLWCIRSQRQCQHHLIFRLCFNSDEMCNFHSISR